MRRIISSPHAPAAIGPYSQAVRAGQFLFCSGQIPLDPESGNLVGGDDVEAQIVQVMKNVDAVLTAAGATFANVVKATIFLTDLGDFATVNKIYGPYFPKDPPARSTIQVAALPRGARVEVEVVALLEG